MSGAASGKVLEALTAITAGDPTAADELLPLLYDELRKLAQNRLRREPPGHTLQPTALVHEAYLRLVGDHPSGSHWESRAQFFAAAATAMRRILVERARRRATLKHGGDHSHFPIGDGIAFSEPSPADMLALDELLDRLASLDKRQSEIVHLRYFAGLTVDQTAEVLDVSPRTVASEWRLAKAWLRRELSPDDPTPASKYPT